MDLLSESQKIDFVKSCPTAVFAYEEQHRQVVVEDASMCTFCEECLRKAESLDSSDLVTVDVKKGRFVFKIESTCVMPPEQIVSAALKILEDKVVTMEGELAKSVAASQTAFFH